MAPRLLFLVCSLSVAAAAVLGDTGLEWPVQPGVGIVHLAISKAVTDDEATTLPLELCGTGLPSVLGVNTETEIQQFREAGGAMCPSHSIRAANVIDAGVSHM